MIPRSRDRSYFCPGTMPALLMTSMKVGLAPKNSAPQSCAIFHKHVGVGIGRIAVVENGAGADQERTAEKIPHHPAGRREEEQPFARMDVHVEAHELHCLQQNAAMAVDDGLGQPRRARGKQNPQRMFERHLFELKVRRGDRRMIQEIVPRHGVGEGRPRVRIDEGQMHDMFELGQCGEDLGKLPAAVERLTAVAVAVAAEQEFRRQLLQPVERAVGAEVGRAHRPDRPDRRGRQHRDHRLRDVRQIRRHPVAGFYAQRPKLRRQRAHIGGEFRPRHAGQRARFAQRQHGVGAGTLMAQNVLRVVEPRAGEPARAGHRPAFQHAARRRRGTHVEIVPDRLPEILDVGRRPLPQRRIVGEFSAALAREPAHEGGEIGVGDPGRARRPQQVALADGSVDHGHVVGKFLGNILGNVLGHAVGRA